MLVRIHTRCIADDIVARAGDRIRGRPWPSVLSHEIEYGVPLFLTQLSETLRLEATKTPFSSDAIGSTAARHGAELLARASRCPKSSTTTVTFAKRSPSRGRAGRTGHRRRVPHVESLPRHGDRRSGDGACPDHRTKTISEEVERLGQSAHELRDILNSAFLAYHTLKRGTVAHERQHRGSPRPQLDQHADTHRPALSEVRSWPYGNGANGRVVTLIDEIAATGMLHSEYRDIQFTVERVDPKLAVEADPQLLTSAVMNLLHNALNNTPPAAP